ncbi:hypothetical protein [Enterobacter cloacae]|uniref:hypothetical protein n=1 Tax=Enterobacter cloacae TaxID=550 RepID=UPI0011132C99|nr:hypothetical protein [Enterobacter cloacae]
MKKALALLILSVPLSSNATELPDCSSMSITLASQYGAIPLIYWDESTKDSQICRVRLQSNTHPNIGEINEVRITCDKKTKKCMKKTLEKDKDK